MSERKQVAFWLEPDLVDEFESSDNKTRLLNDALRLYFASVRQSTEERLNKLEEFHQQFLAYFKRTDNSPHSEFCTCEICLSNRQTFQQSTAGTLTKSQKRSLSMYREPRPLSSRCFPGWEFTKPIPNFGEHWGLDSDDMVIKHDQFNQNGRWGWRLNDEGRPESTGKVSYKNLSAITPKRFEKIVDLLKRAVDQATELNKTVVFESSGYIFEITSATDIAEEYEKYLNFFNAKDPSYISVKVPNPMLPR